jgi:small conductance mechanosensitive channel
MEQALTELTAEASRLGVRIGLGVLILIGFWLGGKVVQRIVRRFYDRSEPSMRDAIGLLGQTAKVALIVLGVVTALGTTGVDVSALVAGLGLTGFALGFAFRDVLSNLLAGLLILFFRPFRHEDRIAVTGFEGRVASIDLRYTILEAEDGRILIPNSVLFTNPISLRRR